MTLELFRPPADDLKRRGLQLPEGVERSGVYRVGFEDGTARVGHTCNIVHRIGSHRRTWEDICEIAFVPCAPTVRRDASDLIAASLGERPVRRSRPSGSDDPFPGWIRWREANIGPEESGRPVEVPDQRAATRPKFDRLMAHADAVRVVSLVRRFVELLIPDPHVTERRNWVVTSMPSTASTRLWHRLVCLSVNNVEVLTIGHQFDCGAWTVMGFMSANPVEDDERLLPLALLDAGAFVAPARYQTVGDVHQLGFDNLDAFESMLGSDAVLDQVEGMVLRLMQRGRGLYGRFHDYNLADVLLGEGPAVDSAGREGFEPSEAL